MESSLSQYSGNPKKLHIRGSSENNQNDFDNISKQMELTVKLVDQLLPYSISLNVPSYFNLQEELSCRNVMNIPLVGVLRNENSYSICCFSFKLLHIQRDLK